NSPSVNKNIEQVELWITEELAAGRISGPFDLEEVNAIARGPIYSSPLLVVVTESAPGVTKYRICQNFSKANKKSGLPAINAMTRKQDYPCQLDMAVRVADWVTNTPEGTLACSFDLASFHRTIPVHPDHKPYLVFQIDGRFYYPHTNSFGMMLASSHAGQVGEPIRQHLEFEGLAPTQRYEDDLQASVTP
ncbi:hypothetical protein HDZ31DRAFT_16510, partial [Schizophyllum fasciatum]